MKIRIHFKGERIPNVAFNRYAEDFADIESATNDERFMSIVHRDGKIFSINLDLVAAVELEDIDK